MDERASGSLSRRTIRQLRAFALVGVAAAASVASPTLGCATSEPDTGGETRAVSAGRYAELVSLISRHRVTRLEELLPLLPSSLRTYYALVHTSPSLQEASYQNPRVILYGADGKLLLAFNGARSQVGFETLEVVEYFDDDARFEYHEVSFPAEHGAADRAPVFSETNPAKCLGCHRRDPRPNWGEYLIWTGAYGSFGSNLFAGPSAERERNEYREFLSGNAKIGRYRFLTPPSGPELSPFLGPADAEADAYRSYKFLTNHRLSGILAKYNSARVLRLLKASPRYPKYRDILTFFPVCAAVNAATPAHRFTHEDLAQIAIAVQKDVDPTGTPPTTAKFLDYVYEGVFGLDAKDLNLVFGDTIYENQDTEYEAGYVQLRRILATRIYRELMATDVFLAAHFSVGAAAVDDPEARARSLNLNSADMLKLLDIRYEPQEPVLSACHYLAARIRREFMR